MLVLLACTAVACGPPHIAPFTARDRKYRAKEYAVTKEENKPATGSIYSDASAGLLEDTRALRVGDVVLVRINEEADARGGASTNLKKESSREAGISKLMGILPALKKAYPDMNAEEMVALASSYDFNGEGQTQRAGKLKGIIGVQVKQELPNGDLFVEGTKVVMINHEEYHLYISGIVRPSDIEFDNSVSSALIADARVEFTGRGDVGDQVRRGWLNKILDKVSPF
jgi:flagellar L-ring protein precursor FlgH